MDTLLKEPSNLFLSKKFSYGYICYLQIEFGKGIALSCYQYPLSIIASNDPIKERFEESITEYFFGRKPEGPEPLDYTYVALLQFGLRYCIGDFMASRGLYNVGSIWWSGTPHIHSDQNEITIKSILIYDLIAYQATQTDQSIIVHHQNMLTLIMRKMGIACALQRHHEGYTLTITTCPFCRNLYSDCQVFAGIIDSFTVWFQETMAHDPQRHAIHITYSHQHQHRIAVTLG